MMNASMLNRTHRHNASSIGVDWLAGATRLNSDNCRACVWELRSLLDRGILPTQLSLVPRNCVLDNECIEKLHDDAAAMFVLGNAYLVEGDRDGAVEIWSKIHAAPYFAQQGQHLLEVEDLDNAIESLDLAVSIEPASNAYRRLLADTYVRVGESEVETENLVSAADWFSKAVEIDPTFLNARWHLASTLNRMGMANDALNLLYENLRRDEGHAYTHYLVGVILWQQKDLSGAIDEYRIALSLLPSEKRWYLELGRLLKEAGQTQDAITIYRRFLAGIEPDDVLFDEACQELSTMDASAAPYCVSPGNELR